MRLKIYKLRSNQGYAIRWWKWEKWLEITLWRINVILHIGRDLAEELGGIKYYEKD